MNLRRAFTALALIIIPFVGRTQITLDYTDLPCLDDISTIQEVDSAQGVGLSPGPAGAGVSWDFSAVTPMNVETLKYQVTNVGPNYTLFPQADMVSICQWCSGTEYNYFYKTGAGLFLTGIEDAGVLMFADQDFNKFPILNYGDSIPNGAKVSVDIGGDSTIIWTWIGYSKADAWGTLTTPEGTGPAIRVHSEYVFIDSLSILGVGQEISRDSSRFSYKWYMKDLGWPVFMIADDGIDGGSDYQTAYYATGLTGLTSCMVEPEICLVTVDSIQRKNLVVWEKVPTNSIASYNVYKETVTAGVYAIEGNVPYDSLSTFVDVNSNPAQKADRYKITAVDTLGSESGQSDFHKTMHLTMNLGIGGEVNLLWDHYEGINFGTYNIYKGNAGGMTLLTSIQSTLTSYTDFSPSPDDSLYVIDVVHPDGCTATKSKNFNSAKSNTSSVGSAIAVTISFSSTASADFPCTGTATATVTGGTAPYTYLWNTTPAQTNATATGLCGDTYYSVKVTTADPATVNDSVFVPGMLSIGELKLASLFKIYPNPSEGEFSVSMEKQSNEPLPMTVFNVLGEAILTENISGNGVTVVDLSSFGTGLYVVQVTTPEGVVGKKIMVQ